MAEHGVVTRRAEVGHLLAVLEILICLDVAMAVLVVHLTMAITEAQAEFLAEVGAAVAEELQAHTSVA